ncbi:hypothetical protein BHE74_00054003 [Ensete ventricosum]|nr:hypothetical protein BHE74_00054003 [Ensete ventricosum]
MMQLSTLHQVFDAAASTKRHAIRFLFEDAKVPRASSEANKDFVESVENSVRQAFLLADLAMAEDCTVCSSSGTMAITGLVLGRQRTLTYDVGEAALTAVVAVEVVGHEGPGTALGVGALLAEAGDLAGLDEKFLTLICLQEPNGVISLLHHGSPRERAIVFDLPLASISKVTWVTLCIRVWTKPC